MYIAIALVVLVGSFAYLYRKPVDSWTREDPTKDLRIFICGVLLPAGYIAGAILLGITSKLAHLF